MSDDCPVCGTPLGPDESVAGCPLIDDTDLDRHALVPVNITDDWEVEHRPVEIDEDSRERVRLILEQRLRSKTEGPDAEEHRPETPPLQELSETLGHDLDPAHPDVHRFSGWMNITPQMVLVHVIEWRWMRDEWEVDI